MGGKERTANTILYAVVTGLLHIQQQSSQKIIQLFCVLGRQIKTGFLFSQLYCTGVPDKRSRILEVIVVRRFLTWELGIWSGEGMGKGGGRGGQFTSNLKPRWTDPVTARRVSK
jgi:hypothetical protein